MKETTTIRKHVLQSSHIRAEANVYSWGRQTAEDYAKAQEERCKEFNEFVRDHRSMDDISLHVEREYADLCEACGSVWEPDNREGVTSCAYCGARLEVASQDVAP